MRLERFIALLLACCVAVFSASSWAEEDIYEKDRVEMPPPPKPVPGEPKVGAIMQPLRWGQQAPFTGTLLSNEAVATVVAELNSIDELIDIEVKRERKLQEARCEFELEQVRITLNADKKILRAQVDARKKDIEVLNRRLKEAEDSAPNLALWVGGGFLGGVLVTVVTTVAVSYASGARD